MGVSLLERGCFKQSMLTLKDAVHAMKGVFHTRCAQHEQEGPDAVQKMMRKACRRFTQPEVDAFACPSMNEPRESMDTVSYDDSLVPLIGLRERCLQTAFRPARIELPGPDPEELYNSCSEDCEVGRDPDLETVVVLNNFAISYYVLAKNTTMEDGDSYTSAKLLENAQSIFDLASGIITNRFSKCDDLMEETRIMAVAFLLTGNIARVLSETGRHEEAEAFSQKYLKIGRAIEECEITDWFTPQTSMAAPAA